MEVFLSIIICTVLGFWLLGIVTRWLLRYWIIKKQREMAQKFGSQGGFESFGSGNFQGFYGFGQQNQASGQDNKSDNKKEEGKVTIQQTQKREGYTVNRKIGEYVEFEEEK